ncbi:Thioredoxin [Seminavis robusta]|uniref:Thioredoxin n=1 Tax=Seminavis robusta TaxID=568900 RepID=A0A9N8H1S7_9STRA|nr:Thioredoxin [Seminavis robusta]|eukprot:Sro7_g006020.1 Thioredoxin (221) ;mRNA; f:123275-123937
MMTSAATASKHSTLRLLVLVSSFLASCTAFQVATQAPPAATSLGYTVGSDVIPETAWKPAPPAPAVDRSSSSSTSSSASEHRLPNMRTVSTRAEFDEFVKDSTQLTVVRFHAPFCKACKAMAPQLERFAKNHPEMNFVQIAYDRRDPEVKGLVQSLRIQKVPYGLVYHPAAGLVESANFNKKYFSSVEQMLEEYHQGICYLPDQVDEYSNVYEAPYAIVQ